MPRIPTLDISQLAPNFPHGDMAGSPHYAEQARPQWRPFAKAKLLTDKLKSPTAIEARKLYQAWEKAKAEVGNIQGERVKVRQELEAVTKTLNNHSFLADEAKRLKIGIGEVIECHYIAQQTKSAAYNSETWLNVIEQAKGDAEAAQQKLDNFVTEHADELAKELIPDSERVHKALSELHKKLEPLEREHDEITTTLRELYGRTEPITEEQIPRRQYDKPLVIPRPEYEPSPASERAAYTPIVMTRV